VGYKLSYSRWLDDCCALNEGICPVFFCFATHFVRRRVMKNVRSHPCIAAAVALVGMLLSACSASPPGEGSNKAPQVSSSMALNLTSTSVISTAAAQAEKQNYLANHVRPDTILHSFHAHEGVWIDCVDVNRQPSMLTPQMEGQSIDQPPPLPPSLGPLPAGHQWARLDMEDHANELDENGNVRHCDPGTVPIRRTTAADLQRFATLTDFFAKGPNRALQGASSDPGYKPPSNAGYEYAREYQYVTNWGFQSFINIWDPSVQASGEHSISQIWVANNCCNSNQETAETGWTVDPLKFGDDNTHFFIYWTDDNYQSTGCYDLDCTGFVQTNNSVTPGVYFSTVSSAGGTQYDAELSWEKSSSTSNWWLLWEGSTWLGYYPTSLYTHGMATQASFTAYGGEVYNSEPGGQHTSTQMGSGQFASAGWQYAAHQRHLQYINTSYSTIDVSPSAQVNNSNCYSMSNGYDGTGDGWGAYEFFGGPGYNATSCP
jgi:hypothetical protein